MVNVLDDRYSSIVQASTTVSILSAAASAVVQEADIVVDRFDLHEKGLVRPRQYLKACSELTAASDQGRRRFRPGTSVSVLESHI